MCYGQAFSLTFSYRGSAVHSLKLDHRPAAAPCSSAVTRHELELHLDVNGFDPLWNCQYKLRLAGDLWILQEKPQLMMSPWTKYFG